MIISKTDYSHIQGQSGKTYYVFNVHSNWLSTSIFGVLFLGRHRNIQAKVDHAFYYRKN